MVGKQSICFVVQNRRRKERKDKYQFQALCSEPKKSLNIMIMLKTKYSLKSVGPALSISFVCRYFWRWQQWKFVASLRFLLSRRNKRYWFFLLWLIAGPLIFLSEAVFILFQICVLLGPRPFLFDHVCLYWLVFRFVSLTLILFSTDGTKLRISFSLGETDYFPSSDGNVWVSTHTYNGFN